MANYEFVAEGKMYTCFLKKIAGAKKHRQQVTTKTALINTE